MASGTWLDRIAPVKAGVTRLRAWGVLIVAIVVLALSLWGFTQPPGELTQRLHLPLGVLSPLLLLGSAWFFLLAANDFRHARQSAG